MQHGSPRRLSIITAAARGRAGTFAAPQPPTRFSSPRSRRRERRLVNAIAVDLKRRPRRRPTYSTAFRSCRASAAADWRRRGRLRRRFDAGPRRCSARRTSQQRRRSRASRSIPSPATHKQDSLPRPTSGTSAARSRSGRRNDAFVVRPTRRRPTPRRELPRQSEKGRRDHRSARGSVFVTATPTDRSLAPTGARSHRGRKRRRIPRQVRPGYRLSRRPTSTRRRPELVRAAIVPSGDVIVGGQSGWDPSTMDS